jgi:hypothetical protein
LSRPSAALPPAVGFGCATLLPCPRYFRLRRGHGFFCCARASPACFLSRVFPGCVFFRARLGLVPWLRPLRFAARQLRPGAHSRSGCPGFSPLSPPAPTPPLGASGSPVPIWVGLRPPTRVLRFSQPSRGSPRALRAPPCALPGAVYSPKIVNRVSYTNCVRPARRFPHCTRRVKIKPFGRAAALAASTPMRCSPLDLDPPHGGKSPGGLDFPRRLWYIGIPVPVPLLRGLPLAGYPRTAESRSIERSGGFFYRSGLPLQPCRRSTPLPRARCPTCH